MKKPTLFMEGVLLWAQYIMGWAAGQGFPQVQPHTAYPYRIPVGRDPEGQPVK